MKEQRSMRGLFAPLWLLIALLAATAEASAQIALMNPGGVRANLTGDAGGQVRYEDLFAVQPFYNNLVTLTLTGAQLQRALEQQWLNQPRPRVLQVSRGFGYSWTTASRRASASCRAACA